MCLDLMLCHLYSISSNLRQFGAQKYNTFLYSFKIHHRVKILTIHFDYCESIFEEG